MKALGPASWGLSKTLIANIEAARTRGVQVFADQYPYEASGTGIVGALMPRSAQVGGRDAMMKRLTGELRAQDPRAGEDEHLRRRGGAETSDVSRYQPNPAFEGQRLSVLATAGRRRARGVRAARCSRKAMPSLVSFNMSEDDIERIMRQPWTMTCTDGDLQPYGRRHAPSARLRRLRAQARTLRARARRRRPAICGPLDDLAGRRGLRLQGPRRDRGQAPSPTC